jgi:uncharacterized membrane protein required for colicin V production
MRAFRFAGLAQISLAIAGGQLNDKPMILAAAQSKLLFNWFDVALVLVLGFGFWRGRKNGMAKELLPAFQWLFIVLAAGFGYGFLGDQLIQLGIIKNVFGRQFVLKTAGYLTAYLLIAGAVWLGFYLLKKKLKPKLEGSNLFGAAEYYLGMIAGIVRYACILIFALAMLNAPHYSSEEIAAKIAYNNRWYGGGVQGYSGNFIPSLDELQMTVFKDSLFGPGLKRGLGGVLISTAAAAPSKAPVVEIQ